MATNRKSNTALTIAGSDSGANAGIQADLLTFAANGVYGTSAITCLTAQNPDGISAIQPTPASVVEAQITQVLSYYPVRAIKTGMLFNQQIIRTVTEQISKYPNIPVVVDPVAVATSGKTLLEPEAISALKELLPLATVITPNLDEAKLLLGRKIESLEEMKLAAEEMARKYKIFVLLKGGHLIGDTLTDFLCSPSGELKQFDQNRIHDLDTHGSGCTLSSAVAAHLALGSTPVDATKIALTYLRKGMENPIFLNKSPFINHLP